LRAWFCFNNDGCADGFAFDSSRDVVLVARMDMAATSNIADSKMLDSAAKSIVAIISRELVLDTPGAAGRNITIIPMRITPGWQASSLTLLLMIKEHLIRLMIHIHAIGGKSAM